LNLIPVIGSLTPGIYSVVDTSFIFREDYRCIRDLIADTCLVSIGRDGEIIYEDMEQG